MVFMEGILQYFQENDFAESDILLFLYKPQIQTLTIVCSYADDVIQAILRGENPPLKYNGIAYHRDMRLLLFHGVFSYHRDLGSQANNPFWKQYADHYIGKHHTSGFTLDYVQVDMVAQDTFQADFEFMGVGTCTFNFKDLTVDRCLVWGSEKEEPSSMKEWQYIEVVTRKPIDFWNPFGLELNDDTPPI